MCLPRSGPTSPLLVASLLVSIPSATRLSGLQEDGEGWTTLPPPEVPLDPAVYACDDADRGRILALIDALQEVDRPGPGYSASLSGTGFAPLPTVRENVGTVLLTDHRLAPSDALAELVELGPKSLPFLLDALDDDRPTRLVVRQDRRRGAMFCCREAPVHPLSPRELAARALHPLLPLSSDVRVIVKTHTVTVGDLAFVAIGQITNRGYESLRYQPSGCTVVNSPTGDPELAAFVREVWKDRSGAAGLLRSLLIDLQTRGAPSTGLQAGAILRLLHYFPAETREVVRERLEGLDLVGDRRERLERNGAVEEELLDAAAHVDGEWVAGLRERRGR